MTDRTLLRGQLVPCVRFKNFKVSRNVISTNTIKMKSIASVPTASKILYG